MENYLIVGGFLFWIFALSVGAAIVVSVINEVALASVIFSLFGYAVLALLFRVYPEDYIPLTWRGWLFVVLGYMSIGVLWSFYKFRVVYANECREKLERRSNVVEETDHEFLDRCAPSVSEFSERIIVWMAWWPISLAIYCLHDLVIDVFEKVFDVLRGIYEGIAKRVRASVAASVTKKGR